MTEIVNSDAAVWRDWPLFPPPQNVFAPTSNGSSYFKANLNIDRDTVRNIIGVKAESLVFSFCSLQNRSFVLINSNFDNKQNHINLLKIEYANLIEQNHTRQCNEQIKLIRERFVRLENEY